MQAIDLHSYMLGAYEIWTAEEGLPHIWPDRLILEITPDMTSMQRAKALAWSVLLGPEPKQEAA